MGDRGDGTAARLPAAWPGLAEALPARAGGAGGSETTAAILADALHGAPDLLAASRPLYSLRCTSKACCGAVDGGATRCKLDFTAARGVEEGRLLLERMAARLAKLPRLGELICVGPSSAELDQLLTMAAAAQPSSVGGVQRLVVEGACLMEGPCDDGLPALLRSLAQPLGRLQSLAITVPLLPADTLQVRPPRARALPT